MWKFFRLLKYFLIKAQEIDENLKYDYSTIAEKFRKQGAKVGKNCSIQINFLASEPYLVEIGDNVAIAPGVKLITHDGASVIFREEFPAVRYFGKIVIEDDCFIGIHSIITAGVRIGKGSIVGPMSVVIRDVNPGSVVIGNPAIRISTVEKYREYCFEKWREQGLSKFNHLFENRNKYEVQKIMLSREFRNKLREHLLLVPIGEREKI